MTCCADAIAGHSRANRASTRELERPRARRMRRLNARIARNAGRTAKPCVRCGVPPRRPAEPASAWWSADRISSGGSGPASGHAARLARRSRRREAPYGITGGGAGEAARGRCSRACDREGERTARPHPRAPRRGSRSGRLGPLLPGRGMRRGRGTSHRAPGVGGAIVGQYASAVWTHLRRPIRIAHLRRSAPPPTRPQPTRGQTRAPRAALGRDARRGRRPGTADSPLASHSPSSAGAS